MIYYNLEKTIYKKKIEKIEFYFSSKKNLERFEKRINEFELENILEKLQIRYRFNILELKDPDGIIQMILIYIYKNIEKRGVKFEYD